MSFVQVGRFRFKNFYFAHILVVSASVRKQDFLSNCKNNLYVQTAQLKPKIIFNLLA